MYVFQPAYGNGAQADTKEGSSSLPTAFNIERSAKDLWKQ